MPTRQDQLHSYQYSVQRVVAALVSHDPDPHRSPLRRAGMTALVSLVTAAVAVGAVAIYGLLTGTRGKEINQDTVVYVEKGSGARFVYNGTEKLLHPVLNYSSALLIANGKEPEVVDASHQQLATVPLGAPLGIPGAPDSMPSADGLLTGAWSVCSQPDAGSSTAQSAPLSTLVVGKELEGGIPAQSDGVLVVDSAKKVYLLYGNRRFAIPGGVAGLAEIVAALGENTATPWPVATAFTNAVPLGADLKPPRIPGRGQSSRDGRYPVGQVLYSALPDGPTQWWVVLADAAAPVTEMQAKLLTTVPGAPAPIEDRDYSRNRKSEITINDAGQADGLPPTAPKLRKDLRSLCVTAAMVGSTGAHSVIQINATVPAGIATTGQTAPNANSADLVAVARGAGAVVVSSSSPSAPPGSGTVTLVTDTGLGYPIPGAEALGKLGYGGVDLTKVQVPSELVNLLHQGPALDPAQAAKPEQ